MTTLVTDHGLRTVIATRYVTPLREGGSLPAIVEADDDGLYVVKFRGAGQGPKALIAELLSGEIGRSLGLRVPESVFVELDVALSKAEPDPEIQDLLRSSAGLNIGLDYLPGALAFVPIPGAVNDAEFAAEVVWFDAFTMNVDRTPRNPNLLSWHASTWLIDHGASIYVHHGSENFLPKAGSPFPPIAEHILLPCAAPLSDVSERMAAMLPAEEIERIVALIPGDWMASSCAGKPEAMREMYAAFFRKRLELQDVFVQEAEHARTRLV